MDLDASIKELRNFKADVIAVTGGEVRFKSMVAAARQHGEQPALDEPREVPAEQLSEQTVSDLHMLALRMPDIERTLDGLEDLKTRLSATEEAVTALQQAWDSAEAAKQANAGLAEGAEASSAVGGTDGASEQTGAPAAS